MTEQNPLLYEKYDPIKDEFDVDNKCEASGKYCALIILLPISLIVGAFYIGILLN